MYVGDEMTSSSSGLLVRHSERYAIDDRDGGRCPILVVFARFPNNVTAHLSYQQLGSEEGPGPKAKVDERKCRSQGAAMVHTERLDVWQPAFGSLFRPSLVLAKCTRRLNRPW